MPNYIEIRNIHFDKEKEITPTWRKDFLETFPEASTLNDSEYFDFLYNEAAPYDEDFYLVACLHYTEEEMKKVALARDFLHYFTVKIERNDDYVGNGNVNL